MAVGLKAPQVLAPVPGVRLGSIEANIKRPNRLDLTLFELAANSICAAVFTQNQFCAAPVTLARKHLASRAPRYLLVNTGYANAGTGADGLVRARLCCAEVARLTGCAEEEVLPFSTGVIGEDLPTPRLAAALPSLLDRLRADGWTTAAQGIMTTDTVAKGVSQHFEIGGRPCIITGIAKGSGMIAPNMATMLAFLATDAAVNGAVLRHALESAVSHTFNRVIVDGDTSTNDACVLVATGQAGNIPIDQFSGAVYQTFADAVSAVCLTLAQALARDGEGATKFMTVEVTGGRDRDECFRVAQAVANSPLVKTAFFAGDPNWGRILAAVGRAGLANLAIDQVEIWLGDVCIVRGGQRAHEYTDAAGRTVMANSDITIRIGLGRGRAQDICWTCDFSYDYVRINAEYRT